MDLSSFTFSSRMDSASSDTGGSMATSDEHLQQVVLHHVAQRAGLLVVPAAPAHAQLLADGDLDSDRWTRGSRAARRSHWRTGTSGCSAPSPCPDSGRCGRPVARARSGSVRGSARARRRRSWPNGFSTTTRCQPSPPFLYAATPARCSCSTTSPNWLGDVAR